MVISLDRRNFKLSLLAADVASFGKIGQEESGAMLRFGCANLD